jgi:hypothetical protein
MTARTRCSRAARTDYIRCLYALVLSARENKAGSVPERFRVPKILMDIPRSRTTVVYLKRGGCNRLLPRGTNDLGCGSNHPHRSATSGSLTDRCTLGQLHL